MTNTQSQSLLDAVLDSWDRSNTILINLLRSVPEGCMEARAMAGSPTVSEMFTHMHHERMISVAEEAPEFAGAVPEHEWAAESDPDVIARILNESSKRVRDAVRDRVETGREMNVNYDDHPILWLQLLIFHESYHHGQIKLVLKLAGRPVSDDYAGPLTWDVWRHRK